MVSLRDFILSVSPISESAWQDINALFLPKQLRKGDYFITEGKTATQIGFICSGIIRAFAKNQNGQEYNKHLFTAPSFIGGYASLITGNINKINQEALTECELLVADYNKLIALYDKHPDFERVARKLAEFFFAAKEQREIELVMLSAEERYLLFRERMPGLEFEIPLYHIASYLGVSAVQLSRIRKNLAR